MDQHENEWHALCLEQWPQECLNDVISFWAEVNEQRNSMNQKRFSNIASLALALLSLPFSSASVERIFSQMNVVHSKLRNRLNVRSVEALLQIKYGLKLQSQTCVNFEHTSDMIKNFSAKDTTTNEGCMEDELVTMLED